jgi:GNAT superfamily N-acetyltransferase
MVEIRQATEADKPSIWQIIKAVIATEDTYTFPADATEEEMLAIWFSPEKHTYVALSEPSAVADGVSASPEIVGTFFLKPNQLGPGAHVGNAGYMVKPGQFGKGIGRAMGEWSLDECRRLGFTALQFNFVVKTNTYAVKLWQSIGMEIVGELPGAFNHKELGLVNAYVMYRKL